MNNVVRKGTRAMQSTALLKNFHINSHFIENCYHVLFHPKK